LWLFCFLKAEGDVLMIDVLIIDVLIADVWYRKNSGFTI